MNKELKKNIDKLVRTSAISYLLIRNIIDELKKNSENEDAASILKNFPVYNPSIRIIKFLNAIGLVEELDYISKSPLLKSFPKMAGHIRDGIEQRSYVGKTDSTYHLSITVFKYTLDRKYDALIELLAQRHVYPTAEVMESVNDALENVQADDGFWENIHEQLKYATSLNPMQDAICRKIPANIKADAYLDPACHRFLDQKDYNQFSPETLIKIFFNNRIYRSQYSDFLDYLSSLDSSQREKLDKKDLADITLTVAQNIERYGGGRSLRQFICKLENFKYLLSAAQCLNDNEDYDYYIEETINPDASDKLAAGLGEYFNIFFYITAKDDKAVLSMGLATKTQQIVVFSCYAVDDIICVTRNIVNPGYDNTFASNIYKFVTKNYAKEIENEMVSVREQIEEHKRQQRLKKLTSAMKVLSLSAQNADVFTESHKARLEASFDKMHGKIYLSLKIGREKAYVVKSISRLVRSFENEEKVQYGKNFEMTHTLDNLNDVDRRLMELIICILPIEHYEYSAAKTLEINSQVFSQMMFILKDRVISFNSKDYRVRLKRLKAKVGINKDKEIEFSTGIENYELLETLGELFIFNNDNKTIDLIDCDREQKALYIFANENNGESIEPVFDKFRDVYIRFPGQIDAPEFIADKLGAGECTINAYFDFENKAITLKTRFEIDSKPCREKDIRMPADKSKLAHYKAYLSSLGFENDKLSADAGVLSFFSADLSPLKKYCNIFLSDNIQNKTLKPFGKPVIRIQYNNNIMKAFLEESDFDDAELEKILAAVKKNKKYVLLKGERIVDLTDEGVKAFSDTVEDLGLDEKNLSKSQRISVVQAIKAFANEGNCKTDDYLKNMMQEITDFKSSCTPIPDVNAQLRPYQIHAFNWMKAIDKYHVGAVLADDMGLGKTLEMITLLKSDDTPAPDLVVCPKSLVFNWINEFMRFDPSARVKKIYGCAKERKESIENINPKKKTVYITSYDSLRNDIEYYEGLTFNHLILDEAQYIKNVNALKSKSVKCLDAAHKYALTGTPIENSVIDLWSIFDFIMPGYFDDLASFKSNYNKDADFTRIISKRIAPFILRRTKRDVLSDLPPKFERIISVEMTKEQRKLYDAYCLEAKKHIQSGANSFDMLPFITRLRQICVDPSMFVDSYNAKSGKLEWLRDLVKEYIENGHRLLIFSSFVQGLSRVEKMLAQEGIDYYIITGDVPGEKRIELMNSFNESRNVNVFLISLKAGGTGLNLVGADTVIHLDPWWNVAAENQASDRAHRIGQARSVEVIKPVCENSIEQRVIELQNIKKDVVDKLISDNDSSVTGATLQDIAFVLNM